MKKKTWQEFIGFIRTGFQLDGQIIEGDFNITTIAELSAMKHLKYEFKGKIIFDKTVIFQGVNLKFSNVEFKDELNINSLSNLSIDYCIANSITLNKDDIELEILGGSINLLRFDNANLKKCVIENVDLNNFESYSSQFTNLNFERTIGNKTKIKNILIQFGKITNINLKNVEIGQVKIPNSKVDNVSGCFVTTASITAVNFNNVKILDTVKINGKVSTIIFNENPSFQKLILEGEITNVNFNNEVNIKSLELKGKIHHIKFIEGCQIVDFISSFNFIDEFEISGGIFNSLKVDKAVFGKEFFISGGEINELNLETENLGLLKIQPKQKTVINNILLRSYIDTLIENKSDLLKIGKLELSNFTIPKDKGSKYIDLKINELSFINIFNYGNVIFSNAQYWYKTKAKLSIKNSDLGKMLLIDCDFTEFQMQFASSKISEIFLAGTNMPKNGNINATTTQKSNHDQRRLALTQIKKIYENRGDLLNATHYHESELMDWLDEIKNDPNKIKEKKIIYSQFKKMYEVRGDSINVVKYHGLELDMQKEMIKGEKGSLHEKFQLFLNKESNNFGQNWYRAFWCLLIVNFIFYFFYLWSLGLIFQKTSIDYNLIGYYFEFLNPTHKVDFIKNNEGLRNIKINGLAVFLDFFNRIFVGFLIYQLISAFRKYGKK